MRAASNASVDEPSEVWIDLAVVVVRDLRSGEQAVATSGGIQFPMEFVGVWAEGGQRAPSGK